MLQDELAIRHFSSDDYELKHKIGQGGFSSVFKAIHTKTNQPVAIKFLQLCESTDPHRRQQQLARFERESDFVSQLSHPNIVRLLDKGNIGNTSIYNVFEYVEGISLSDHLKQHGVLSVEETHRIMLQILDALVHAHQQGIIHRDIKPSNIMLTKTGAKYHVKLLDFGISTLTLGQQQRGYQSLTMTQESVGTPNYCTPEQLRGELTTFSSDLYMWGLVFIECLTGTPAIAGASIAETYHQHLNDVPIFIPAPLYTHPLGQLLKKVLKKKESERFRNAQTLYDELNELVVTNLEGQFPLTQHQHNSVKETRLLRQDDPDHPLPTDQYLTERKQITCLALQIRIQSRNGNTTNTDVVETIFQSIRSQSIDIANRYGGFHVGNLTHFSLFYFGYPIASDHDARLAARTALEIASLAKKQSSYVGLQQYNEVTINIGIHSGILLKQGNLVPDGIESHYACDLALQGQGIICSLNTKAILESYYQFVPHQSDQTAYAKLISERVIEAFGFTRGIRNDHALIGRSKVLEQVRSCIKNLKHAHQSVHLHGEAGIGKSRLIHELRQLEAAKSQLVFQCLPEYQNNALYPVLTVAKHLLTRLFEHKEAIKNGLVKLITTKELTGYTTEIITVLSTWLDIDSAKSTGLSKFDLSLQRALLFDGLTHIFMAANEGFTVDKGDKQSLYIFEDIHWADAMTVDFIAHLKKQVARSSFKKQVIPSPSKQGQSISLITTSRQAAPKALLDNAFDSIQLTPLSLQATEQFITSLFDGAEVTAEIMTELVNRSDGIPLFIEELVFMLKQSRMTYLNQGVICLTNSQQIQQLPSNIRESIQNKIDTLIYAKETLQLAAIIGREFHYSLLIAASHFSPLQVQNDLTELLEKNLIIRQRNVNGDQYLFKHALIQEVVYDSIDNKQRPQLHELIAISIQKAHSTYDRSVAEILAKHYQYAQRFNESTQWYYHAAKEAQATFAMTDAIWLFQNALNNYQQSLAVERTSETSLLFTHILKGLSDCLIRDGQHQNARPILQQHNQLLQDKEAFETLAANQMALGKTYEVVHQHDEALHHYQTAYASLLKAPHSNVVSNNAWWKTWLAIKNSILDIYYWRSNIQQMQLILKQVEPVLHAINDNHLLIRHYESQLQFSVRNKRYLLGVDELALAEKAVEVATLSKDQRLLANTLFMQGFCCLLCNKNDEAKESLTSSFELASHYKDKELQTRCGTYLSTAYRRLKDTQKTKECAEQSLTLAKETKMNDYIAVSLSNIAWSYFTEEDYKQAGHYLEQSLNYWDKVTNLFQYPFLLLSYLPAIALCVNNKEFAEKYHKRIPSFAKTLLDHQQVPLPNNICHILAQLLEIPPSDTMSDLQSLKLIEKMQTIATEQNLL
ncbi:tetratricopeptide repeat protein [Marinomonas agarivorans]|nr:tetratricopeptide repeat protein [Marinomonas agarivorans]